MEILIIFLLILVNGFFAMSEIAVVSARRSRLESYARKNNAGAKKAIEMAQNPSRFLSTVQVGITVIGIVTGLYGGEALAAELEVYVSRVSFLQAYSKGVSLTLVVILITYFSIVLGELVPKRIGLTMPESIARVVSRPMHVISIVAAPFIWLLSKSTEFIMRLFNIKKTGQNQVTEEEIKAIIQEGAEAGSIEEIEQDLVENVLQMSDRAISSLMTPRHQITWLDTSRPFDEQVDKLTGIEVSVFPACDDSLDKIKGVIYLRDYARAALKGETWQLEKFIRQPLFFPESIRAYKALEEFQKTKIHFGVVVDEYGSIKGIVTLNDLLDALIGDVIMVEEDGAGIVRREDGSLLVSGSVYLDDLLEYLGEEGERKEDEGDFNTVAGLVFHYGEHIPRAGFAFTWLGYKVEVVDMDGHKVDKILLTKTMKP